MTRIQVVPAAQETHEGQRVIEVNDPDFNNGRYPSTNYVRTAKYTIWSFLPVSLFLQFLRLANVYFLMIAILQSIKEISPLQPFSAIAPLVFVLFLSIVREGLEDYRRYRDDVTVNSSSVLVFQQGLQTFVSVPSKNLRVGELVKILDRQTFPADLVVLSCSDPEGKVYIETASLDGERNLKAREAPKETLHHFNNPLLMAKPGIQIVTEMPNDNLHRFEGNLKVNQVSIPLDQKQILLRNAVLKNTKWVLAVVVFNGHETKLMMNNNSVRFKQSRTERIVSQLVLVILMLQIIICAFCGAMSNYWTSTNWNASYLMIDKSATYTGFISFWSFVLTLSTMIPISLVVTLELVKLIQVLFIMWDELMYYAPRDQPAKASTSTLNEELGQVKYVFSDKTGTLTANKMEFRACSIANQVYGAPLPNLANIGSHLSSSGPKVSLSPKSTFSKLGQAVSPIDSRAGSTDSGGSSLSWGRTGSNLNRSSSGHMFHQSSNSRNFSIPLAEMIVKPASPLKKLNGTPTGRVETRRPLPDLENGLEPDPWSPRVKPNQQAEITFNFKDDNLLKDLRSVDSVIPPLSSGLNGLTFANRSEVIRDFFTVLALCHSVLPEVGTNGEICYQGSSPDEVTLVDAARHVGFVFKSRNHDIISVDILGKPLQYQVLAEIEFTSTRKRMSIICRCPDGKIRLFCKGADGVIKRLLAPNQQQFDSLTDKHLHTFSVHGLRTLCVAESVLSQGQFDSWFKQYHAATTALTQRLEKIDAAASLIERDLFLLGATGVEDKLQDGVPECIVALQRANMYVWMLTGDKLETAVNIGMSCRLIDSKMKQCKVDHPDSKFVRSTLESFRHYLDSTTEPTCESCLIIDGPALDCALQISLVDLFVSVAIRCKTVICCRVSPAQKGDVVRTVKRRLKSVTLSIGDGANDVVMIKEAHIGIGVFGEEGMQAVQASDYSIGQFRYLERLLLVHGRWSYIRVSNLILYFFYKNLCFTMAQFWFGFYSGFSGQTFWEDWYVTCFNMIFTALPVMINAVFEQDLNPSDGGSIGRDFPLFYFIGQENRIFTIWNFVCWCLSGVCDSLVVFFFSMQILNIGSVNGSGLDSSMWAWSLCAYTTLMVVVTAKIAVHTRHWTIVNFLAVTFLSLGLYFCFVFFYNLIPDTKIYRIAASVYGTARFWLVLVLCVVTCIFPDVAYQCYCIMHRPDAISTHQQLRRIHRSGSTPSSLSVSKSGAEPPVVARAVHSSGQVTMKSILPVAQSVKTKPLAADGRSGTRLQIQTVF